MIYQGGVSTSESLGVGVGFNSGEVAGFRTSSTKVSALAQQYAPPRTDHAKQTENLGLLLGAIAVASFLLLMYGMINTLRVIALIGLILTCIFSFLSSRAYKGVENAALLDLEAKKKLNEWENSVVCHTCNNVFQLNLS